MKTLSRRRGRLAWLIAATGSLLVLMMATQPAGAADRERPCNGSIELCPKPFNEVVLPTTHNSMSAEELGWSIPNQLFSIPNQLKQGVRGLLIDTYYGKANAAGAVVSVPEAQGHQNGNTMYLCHAYCQLGSTELVGELTRVRDYLASNPREVILIVNEDYIHPDDFAKAVTASGLLDYVYTGPTDRWPTLGEMIAGNQRVVMLAQDDAGNVPWYHKGYDGPLRETPYDFRGDFGTTRDGISELTEPGKLNESCRPLRGGDNGALFLMNHWVNGSLDNTNKVAPDPEVARILNRKDVLVNRALACKLRRGIMPTLVAVDDFGEGDLIGAVRELNGVVAEPFLETTRPKPAVVRAGRRAVLRVPVSNFGDADGKVKVCAKVPRRLAKKPRCSVVEVAIGATTTARINIWTKRRAKGKGKVSLTLRTTGDSVSTATNLKVKPKPKKIKRKKRR